MIETKHTPGPWFRDKESGFDCDVRAANGRKIASVNVQCMPRTKQQFDGRKAENNANAYLIAAAPELLDALRSIKKRMYEPRPFSIRACEAIIDDAIAKATGGAA